MDYDTRPSTGQLNALLALVNEPGSRCLIHCEMGVIRTGMMVVAVARTRYGARGQAVWRHFPLFGHKLGARRQQVQAYLDRCALP